MSFLISGLSLKAPEMATLPIRKRFDRAGNPPMWSLSGCDKMARSILVIPIFLSFGAISLAPASEYSFAGPASINTVVPWLRKTAQSPWPTDRKVNIVACLPGPVRNPASNEATPAVPTTETTLSFARMPLPGYPKEGIDRQQPKRREARDINRCKRQIGHRSH